LMKRRPRAIARFRAGDLWTFRAIVYKSYPGLSADPIVLFAMQPSCAEWAARANRRIFKPDAELARLIPAMKFMRQNSTAARPSVKSPRPRCI